LSGLSTRRFSFEGFLPYDKKERESVLEELKDEYRTVIIYEAPHHLRATLDILFQTLGNRRITLCRELTKRFETVIPTDLVSAIKLYEEEEPKGEYVLVLEGADKDADIKKRQESFAALSVEEHVAHYEAEGLDRKAAMKKAAEDGCRIIIGGMFGNGTVSYDNARHYFARLLRRGHMLRLRREINRMHEVRHYTRKSMWLTTVRDVVCRSSKGERRIGYVQESYLKKTGARKRLEGIQRRTNRWMQNETGYHRCFFGRDTFRHYGEFSQHHSLYSGVLLLDPTRDRRMVDFCMSLPPDQFTANGKMRRMITEYMEELMPPHILKSRKQGLQSADQKLRILRQKDAIVDEWLRIYREHAEDLRIDTDKAIRDLEKGKLEDCEDFDLTRHIYTTCFLRYMDRVEKMCGEKSRNRILPV
jgi:hypothetical protein